jgi:hypothetical protein
MKGETCHHWRFYDNGDWVQTARHVSALDFWNFTESLDAQSLLAAKRGKAPQMSDGELACIAGTFIVESGKIVAKFTIESPIPGVIEWWFESSSRGFVWHLGDGRSFPLAYRAFRRTAE